MRMIRILALAAVAAAAGCRSNSGGNDSGNNTACTVTFSGAITATAACTVSATYGREIIGRSTLSIVKSGDPKFDMSISQDGKLSTGTITESSSSLKQVVIVASTGDPLHGGPLWSQSTEDPAHGSMTVNLTSVSLGPDGYTFTIHGTADATLTPSLATPGATGTVTMHVVF